MDGLWAVNGVNFPTENCLRSGSPLDSVQQKSGHARAEQPLPFCLAASEMLLLLFWLVSPIYRQLTPLLSPTRVCGSFEVRGNHCKRNGSGVYRAKT